MASSGMASHSKHFNPYTQTITLLAPDSSPINITLPEINDYLNYGVRISINYSSQIGASFVLLAVLLLTTRKEKRSSPIYYLNIIALAANAIRNLLQCIYFSGPLYSFYTYFAGDYSMIPRSQIGASIAGIVLSFIVLVCVEASLVLQVKAVCITMRDALKTIITILSAIVALTAIGFRFGLMVENAKAVMNLNEFIDFEWLAATNNYVTTGSICFFSAVFVAKLGVALNERRKMHLKQFGPMQVIFIMGCQTLFVPAIFSILQNFTSVPELGSQVLTLTALFLPLSSIWAAASIANNKPLAASSSSGNPYYTGASSGGASTDYKSKDRKGSRSSARSGKGGLFKGLGLFATAQQVPTDLEKGNGNADTHLTSGSAHLHPASRPVAGRQPSDSSAYHGEATSRAEAAGTPVGPEMSTALHGNGVADDEGLEKDLKIHMGRSFGVEEERTK